ncbi:Lamin tail domain-containing protein 2 [Varanus komodoensis]|nr:Lamin tail domain-containing protein 2 [Varanus komodoensis]
MLDAARPHPDATSSGPQGDCRLRVTISNILPPQFADSFRVTLHSFARHNGVGVVCLSALRPTLDKSKKRKVSEENRTFSDDADETGLPVCLICDEKLANNKKEQRSSVKFKCVEEGGGIDHDYVNSLFQEEDQSEVPVISKVSMMFNPKSDTRKYDSFSSSRISPNELMKQQEFTMSEQNQKLLENPRALLLLLHQRDLEIKGLKRAAQKDPSDRLSCILQELVKSRQKVSSMKSENALQKEVDQLSAELTAVKEDHKQEMQQLEDKLLKSKLHILQLQKTVKTLSAKPEGKIDSDSSTSLDEGSKLARECFERCSVYLHQYHNTDMLCPAGVLIIFKFKELLNKNQLTGISCNAQTSPPAGLVDLKACQMWSETGSRITSTKSDLRLRRIPKHTSFVDAFHKFGSVTQQEKDEIITQLESVAGKAQLHHPIEGSSQGSSRNESLLPCVQSSVGALTPLQSDLSSSVTETKTTESSSSLPSSQDKIQQAKCICMALPLGPWRLAQSDLPLGPPSSGQGYTPDVPSSFIEKCKWCHSGTGSLRIVSVHRAGFFIRIFNALLNKEVDLSSYIIQQWVGGYPVSIYHFPSGTVLPAQHHITVWAAGASLAHEHPTDKLSSPCFFRAGPECITILRDHNGQIVSQYRNPHQVTTAAIAYDDNVDLSVDKFPLNSDDDTDADAAEDNERTVKASPSSSSDEEYFSLQSLEPQYEEPETRAVETAGVQDYVGYYASLGVADRAKERSLKVWLQVHDSPSYHH